MSSLLSSTVLASSQANEKAEIVRRSADFHPTIWGDYFLKYTPQYLEFDPSMEQEALKLKEEVKDMLISSATTPSKNLQFIDAIQRLGFAYHFEVEIKEMLGRIMENINDLNGDINTVSLCFRLLRQEGFNISIDVLKKFTNREGRFFDDLKHDVEGILSLYEAAHLRVCGEPILEEALAFSTTHLELSVAKSSKISSFLSEKVKYALREPIHKGLPRVEARRFISVYHDDPSHDEVLLRFAKIDFNSVQRLHQKELHEVTRWWKDLDFARKLPFTRDRLVEGYIWPVGVYFEPKYSLARVILTKVIGITTLIDDIYDVYGTLEELELFTDAIERWSPSCKDQLPEYMQYCYEALLQLYDEIEEELAKEDRAYRMYYAKETMKQLVQSYFVEAQWFHNNYTPTLEEYMKIALVSSTYTMLTATSFLGMGNEVTPQVFDWLSKDPKIVRGSAVVCRLMDDVVSHKFEQDRGHVDSSVECYMKQYKVSEEEACDELKKQVVNAWKDMTEECLEPRNAPMPVLTRVLNLARVIDAVYKDGDGYTHAGGIMKRFVKSLFIENVPT